MPLDPFQHLNKDSKWVKIPTGGSYTGTYLGCEAGEKYRGSDTINYRFLDGKTLNSGSKRLAAKMMNVPENAKVCIKKFGAGMDTVYEVEIVGAKQRIEQTQEEIQQAWDEK